MIRVRAIVLVVALLVPAARPALSQMQSATPLEDVRSAFAEAKADSIAAFSAARVEIAVLGKSRLYSRSQARFVLKSFFKRYPPVRVTFADPSRTETGIFAAGSYRFAADRKPLRLYVRLRRHGSAWVIREIVVERAER